MKLSFPLYKSRVWYELEWATRAEAERLVEVFRIPGGYAVYERGVPVDNILA